MYLTAMDPSADFKAYQARVAASLVGIVHTSNRIADRDLSFHRSSSEKVSKSLDAQNAHLLRLTSRLLKAATQESSVKPPHLRNQDSVEDNWRGVVDVVDDVLEKADASLDEYTGVIRRLSPALPDGVQTPPRPQSKPFSPKQMHWPKVFHKPQETFRRKPDNHNTNPWKPLLVDNPHAIKPLDESISNGKEG